MFNADFRPVVVSNGDVFCYVTADVVTRTQDQGGTGFFDAMANILNYSYRY